MIDIAEYTISTRLTLEGEQEYRRGVADAAGALAEFGKCSRGISMDAGELAETLKRLQGEWAVLSKAQKEQSDTGYLSLSTLSSLLEKYPDLTRYLEEAEDGYRLTDGALQDYIASQRAEYQLAYDSAAGAAKTVIDAEAAKGAQIDATTQSVREQIKALALLYQANAKAAVYGAGWQNSDEYLTHGSNALLGSEDYQKSRDYWDVYESLVAAEEQLKSFDRAAASLERDGAGKSGGSKSGSKKEKDAAMEELQAWLEDMDHQIYLWGKEGGHEEAIAGTYRDMQEAVHALAEEYRAKGLGEDSEQIQKLQKLWWGYADALEKQNQEAYDRELSALEESLAAEEITTAEYLDGRAALQTKYLKEGSAQREKAEKDRVEKGRQLNKAAYDEELADQKYYLDMDIISEEQYYIKLAELRDEFLEKDSEEWRRATVELHNYLEKCREEELAAAKKAYDEQLKALDDALDERLDAAKDAYNAEVDAIKQAYSDETAAIKKGFAEQKTALKDGYDRAKEAAKAAYEERKKAIQDELKLEKDRLNAILEGIDAEIQARRELREDEDLDAKIAAARKRLENAQTQREYARTDEDRAEWDKEIVRLKEALDKAIQDKEDTEFYRQKELEKEAVQDRIDAAEEKASQAQEEAKTAYDAKVKELEAEYKANLAKLEARQERELAEAKADYETKLEAAKEDYDRRVAELKADYEASKSRLEDKLAQAENRINGKYDGGQGGGREYSAEVHAIANANDVPIDVAQDMYNMNQWHKDDPDYTPYSSGGYSAAKVAAAAAGAIGAAVAGMVTGVGRAVEKTVKNSASVTINQASSLTEGQVARTVKKLLDDMGR